MKVWLNGKEVLSKNMARVFAIDQDVVAVNLKGGTNEILVKVCNRTVHWGFCLRITDTQGRPFDDLNCTPAVVLSAAGQ